MVKSCNTCGKKNNTSARTYQKRNSQPIPQVENNNNSNNNVNTSKFILPRVLKPIK